MKKNLFIIVLLVLVAVLGYVVWYKNPASSTNDEDFPIPTTEHLVTYTDTQYGFSFDYPKEMIKGEGKIFLPGPANEAIPAVTFTRVANVVHQSMSGNSEPTTDNPKVSVAVLQGSIADVAKDFSVYDKISENIFQAGVEGEGVTYYLVALGADKTVLFQQSFIDERNNPVYKDVPGFLPLAEQEKLVLNITKSFSSH